MPYIKFNDTANIAERQKVGHLTLEQEQKAISAINILCQLSGWHKDSVDIKAIQDLIYSYENLIIALDAEKIMTA